MFQLWKRIEEVGAVAIPDRADALSGLEWVEVAERYPDLVLPEYFRYDIESDSHLRFECPFVRIGDSYKFQVAGNGEADSLNVFVDLRQLLEKLGAKDYCVDDDAGFFEGILTCSCGVPGCAGLWNQSFHVSERMVRWDVCCYETRFELFFDRKTYDEGVVCLLHDLCLSKDALRSEFGGGYNGWGSPEDHVAEVLARFPAYGDIWTRLGFAPIEKS